jgi:hypothetical protein
VQAKGKAGEGCSGRFSTNTESAKTEKGNGNSEEKMNNKHKAVATKRVSNSMGVMQGKERPLGRP